SLERVNKSGARFDPDKNNWYNQQWLQRKSDAELAGIFLEDIKKRLPDNGTIPSNQYVAQVVSLIKDRASFVSDFWDLGSYFFETPSAYDEKGVKKQWKEDTAEIMEAVVSVLEGIEDYTSENIEAIVKKWIAD